MTPQPGAAIVLVGPSAAGKSTYAARFAPTQRICLDTLRGAIADSEVDQSATTVAAQIQDLLLDARLSRNLPTVLDSTNLLAHVRAKILARARAYQRPCVAVLFNDVDLDECIRRNAGRDRQVPLEILRWQHTLIPSREQLVAEGFTEVLPAHAEALAGGAR
ncbi:AAA family ATPase [Streptomyces mayteni]